MSRNGKNRKNVAFLNEEGYLFVKEVSLYNKGEIRGGEDGEAIYDDERFSRERRLLFS